VYAARLVENGQRKILSGWTGTGPRSAVRSVATKMVFFFCPWSTATDTTKPSMRRPKARQTGTLAAADSIPRRRKAGLNTEPDHNAAKRTKASTSPDRYDGGAVGTRTSGLGNTSNNHNTSKQSHTRQATKGELHSWPVREDGVGRAIQTPGLQEEQAARHSLTTSSVVRSPLRGVLISNGTNFVILLLVPLVLLVPLSLPRSL